MDRPVREILEGIDPYRCHIRVTCGSRKPGERRKFDRPLGEVKMELERAGMTVKPKDTKRVKIVVIPDEAMSAGTTGGKRVVRFRPFLEYLRDNPEQNRVETIVPPEEDDESGMADIERMDIMVEAEKIENESSDQGDIIEQWNREISTA